MRIPTLQDAATFLSILPRLQKPLAGGQTQLSLPPRPELPGGSPLSLCHESRPTDLFTFESVVLSKQPIYL